VIPSFSFCSLLRRPPVSPLFPYTTLFRSSMSVGISIPLIESVATVLWPVGLTFPSLQLAAAHDPAAMTWRSKLPSADLTSTPGRSEEHTSELQSREKLVCRLLLEKKTPPR